MAQCTIAKTRHCALCTKLLFWKDRISKSSLKDNWALLQVVLYCKIALPSNDVCKFYFEFVALDVLFKNYCRQAVFQHKQCPFCPTVFLLHCGKSKLVQCKVWVSKPTRVVFETRQPVCVGKSKYDSRVPKRLIRCTVFITFCATFSQRCFVKKTICCVRQVILFKNYGR